LKMNKILLLTLVGLDTAANFSAYLIFEDYEALVICFLKFLGFYGVITGELTPILGYVFLSCIITITRTIQFIEIFRVYVLCLNIHSIIMCFILLKNICSDELISIELGFSS